MGPQTLQVTSNDQVPTPPLLGASNADMVAVGYLPRGAAGQRARARRRSRWLLASAAAVVLCGCAGSEHRRTEARAEALLRGASARQGQLELRCDPSDAEVVVDGVPQGVCDDFTGSPRWLVVGNGLHHVVIHKPGFWPYETWYQASGARAVLRVKLRSQDRKDE
jgi:hypothetical protein